MNRVQINYRSGISITVTCAEFSVERKLSGSMSLSWVNMNPKPLLLGTDDVESVWDLGPVVDGNA